MNATSTSTSTDLDRCQKILELWHKVEFFIPFNLQQQVLDTKDAEWSVRSFTEAKLREAAPNALWQVHVSAERELSGFVLYLGIFDKSDLAIVTEQVVRETLTPDQKFEQIERGDLDGPTCFARINLNIYGEPLLKDVSVSTVPWALGSIQQRGLGGLSFDAFHGGVLGLQEELKNFQAQRLNERHQGTSSEDEHAKSAGAQPLSGAEILALLEIFYRWAAYRPVAREGAEASVVVIRAKAGFIHKKHRPDSPDSHSTDAENTDEDDDSEPMPDTEIDILNSFYAKDIERAISAIKKGEINAALAAYLTPVADSARIDLYQPLGRQLVFESLRPTMLNSGHWLDESSHVMSLMQQFAIGQVFDRLDVEGVFSVNGPPGTGKTTLLRDIFAENITRRARVLAGYAKAGDAFQTRKVSINFEGIPEASDIALLRPELTGYEMIVASSNNAAVENISRDLPKAKAIGKTEWRNHDGTHKFGYLQPIAHKVAAQNKKGEFDTLSSDDMPWGLISCATGNKTNRKVFLDRIRLPGANPEKPYPYGLEEPYAKGFSPDKHQSVWLWRDRYRGPSFADAKASFIKADATVAQRVAALQTLADLCNELSAHTEASFTARTANRFADAQQTQWNKQSIFDVIARDLKFSENQLESLRQVEFLINKQRPGWLSRLLRRQSFKQYKKDLAVNHASQREHLLCKYELGPKRMTAQSDLNEANNALNAAHKSFTKRQAQWLNKLKNLANLRKQFPQAQRPANLDDLEQDDWQRHGVWRDDELTRLRSELFAAALQLHEAWLAEVLRKWGGFSPNIIALCNLLSGKRLKESRHALPIWQSLFMLVPVISSTFASIGSQFRDLGSNTLGWLFIDEAGQAVPQAAVGALWRCKRAVIVGDPLQIEPVFTVPIKLIEALFKSSGLPDDLKITPDKVSSQTLADEANPLGTRIMMDGCKSQWIGSPLRVHRRCVDPMFGIANAIAYDNKMVYGFKERTPPKEALNLGQSAWVNVPGSTSFRQVVPSQITLVFQAVVALYQSLQQLPPLYIISPFKRIKIELIDMLSDVNRWKVELGHSASVPTKTALRDWCDKRIGTVHTFQGKEESIVWMVLGCDDKTAGAVSWATSKPNLLNVAVTRAKHRFFMIGDETLWAGKTYFDTAHRGLPVISGDDFLLRMKNPDLSPRLAQ